MTLTSVLVLFYRQFINTPLVRFSVTSFSLCAVNSFVLTCVHLVIFCLVVAMINGLSYGLTFSKCLYRSRTCRSLKVCGFCVGQCYKQKTCLFEHLPSENRFPTRPAMIMSFALMIVMQIIAINFILLHSLYLQCKPNTKLR